MLWTLARRFLAGGRSRLLDGTARAALLATGLGVTAMVIAMALLTGYTQDLQAKLIGENAAIGVYPLSLAAPEDPAAVVAKLRALPGVVRVARAAYGQGLLTAGDRTAEVTLRGVEPGSSARATVEALAPGPAGTPVEGLPGAVLGAELAKSLGLEVGQPVRLTALGFEGARPKFRYQTLRVTGVFTTGFSEFDRSWLEVDREWAERLSGRGAGSVLFELTLANANDTTEVAAAAEKALGPAYLVNDFRKLNRELFLALRLQKIALFFALGLIVLVSTFNVGSTLVVLVRERMRDVGALAAMGLSRRRIVRVFLLCGVLLGGFGTVIGVAVGSTIAWVLTTFRLIRFNPEVAAIYFIDAVPFRVELADLAAIVGFSLLLTVAACLAPALRAATIAPAEALRYE